MGRSKPLLDVRGQPLIAAHVEALAAFAHPVIAVLGAEAERVRAVLPESVVIAVNTEWATTWPADSLRIGLDSADIAGPCWVTPVDIPPPSHQTLSRLLGAGAPAVPVGPDGQPGHPVLLDAELVAQIRAQAPQGGLRTLLAEVRRVVVNAADVAWDFDDPAAFEAWRGDG
jgi:CTP:molybdopterin cytidylyltransferase MocA